MNVNEKAYVIAKKELGISEILGPESNPRINEYHATTTYHANSDEIPWCSSFMNWCILNAGGTPTKSAAARSWLSWGMQPQVPYEGDIVVLKRGNSETSGHVGFYVESHEDKIKVLGGNQSNKVCYAWYKAEDVIGYRREHFNEEQEFY